MSIEGALLSPEWLAKIAALSAEHQTEADYRIDKGLNLRDEISRAWRVAQGRWSELKARLEHRSETPVVVDDLVVGLFERAFDFRSLTATSPVEVGGRTYPLRHHALGGRVPVVIAPGGFGLDEPSTEFGDEGRRRSAFGLTQELLNADDRALWGIATDGMTLRILRDNASLTRPAWIEADLQRIFTEERFPDFALLWLLVHESRFGAPGQPVTDCALEAWRTAGRELGTRAQAKLRDGVEDALIALGTGFLSHPDNERLRTSLHDGALTKEEYVQQLLRLVYRLIFLLTVEERGWLHPKGASDEAKTRYAAGYGVRRLRDRAVKRSAHDHHADLWDAMKIVLRGLANGEPLLGLPALGGLFSEAQCASLDSARVDNAALLWAIFRLSWLREDSGLSRVNWRDMGPEELGSVYESLLELVPQLSLERREFSFASGAETKGNDRKKTGSYYTPDSLVQVLLDGALEPVIQAKLAANPTNAAAALLQLAIVDPACGSGHFLLSAARRLAGHLARVRASGTPSADEYRHALRDVVGHCIFGVDLNPMAVELCRVSLWMEAIEPGRPLSFLDSHIQRGNALLGTSPELMAKGIPDSAWEPIEGDDKKTASLLKKRNKLAAEGQRALDSLWSSTVENEAAEVARGVTELDAAPDASLADISSKHARWGELRASAAYRHQRFVADAWCAAFVWPKPPVESKQQAPLVDAAPTNELWRQLRDAKGEPPPLTVKTVGELSEQYQFFHWHLQFPQVFARGGFDAVIGNPPWDSLWFREEEFFASVRPDITAAATAAARKRMIAQLATENPKLHSEYLKALRGVDGANAFVRSGVSYPLCGVGRVNLFGLFAELGRRLVSKVGRVGQILPSGIVSDDSTKMFFQAVVDGGQLVSFFDFENRDALFPGVHRSFKFGVLILDGRGDLATDAEFVFFAANTTELKEPGRKFSLGTSDIRLLNPETRTCPIFRSRRDATLTKSVYGRLPTFLRSDWAPKLRRLLNASDDSGEFKPHSAPGLLPLYEAKYFHHFDHRWLTYAATDERALSDDEKRDPAFDVVTRHWYPAADVEARFGGEWRHDWTLVFRDIARATDERTFIAASVPSLAIPNTAKVIFIAEELIPRAPLLLANVTSFAFDFISRQKIGGTHMSGFIAEQLPVLPAASYETVSAWAPISLRSWVWARALELSYTTWSLTSFAKAVGHEGPPFKWEPERRAILRAELDAAYLHLYGISHDDASYILDTFPIVRRNDEKAHGEFRTKRLILQVYEALADAGRTGRPYVTRLDPPPADPRVAHTERSGSRALSAPHPSVATAEARRKKRRTEKR